MASSGFRGLHRAVDDLNELVGVLDIVQITDDVARRTGELAEAHALRGYDAMHVAAAELLDDPDLVVVAGDAAMLSASEALGFAIARTA